MLKSQTRSQFLFAQLPPPKTQHQKQPSTKIQPSRNPSLLAIETTISSQVFFCNICNRQKMLLRHLYTHSGKTDTEAISIFLHTSFYMFTMSKKLKRLQCSSIFCNICMPRKKGTAVEAEFALCFSKELSCRGAKTSIRNLMEIMQASSSIRPVQFLDYNTCSKNHKVA